jgi:hypothetical protein
MNGTIKTAEIVATMGVNEFLAHEVQNPLSAAMLALSFVTSAVNETAHISNDDFRKSVQEDAQIADSSLHFIDEFLRVCLTCIMLPATKQSKTGSYRSEDVLEPVCNILYQPETAELTLLWTVQRIWICRDGLLASQARSSSFISQKRHQVSFRFHSVPL